MEFTESRILCLTTRLVTVCAIDSSYLHSVRSPCQQRPERWRTEVLDFCTGSHKSSSFTRKKFRTSNNPVPVLRIPSEYGWMSCSLNESNLNKLRHKLQACSYHVRIWTNRLSRCLCIRRTRQCSTGSTFLPLRKVRPFYS